MQNWKRNWLVVSELIGVLCWVLTPALKNLKNLHFNGLPLTKVCNVLIKKVHRSYVWWHWKLIQNLRKNWFWVFKNDMRNLGNFHQRTWKSQNWNFDGILLFKVENLWAWNLQAIINRDNEERYKIGGGIDLSIQNWHEEFYKFWPKSL